MDDKTLLNEFNNVTVATIYSDRVELDCPLIERLLGSGFYAMVEEGCYYIVDMYDDDELTYVGNDLVGALRNLNDYSDYFNYYPNGNYIDWADDWEDFWMTDFEYSLRSADEFKKVVSDTQSKLKEGNE